MAEKKAKRLPMYKHYVWKGDRDPAIDEIHTILDEAGATYYKASQESGVSASAIMNWIEGKTMRPQHCTLAAVAAAYGFDYKLVRRKADANIVSMRRARVA